MTDPSKIKGMALMAPSDTPAPLAAPTLGAGECVQREASAQQLGSIQLSYTLLLRLLPRRYIKCHARLLRSRLGDMDAPRCDSGNRRRRPAFRVMIGVHT